MEKKTYIQPQMKQKAILEDANLLGASEQVGIGGSTKDQGITSGDAKEQSSFSVWDTDEEKGITSGDAKSGTFQGSWER